MRPAFAIGLTIVIAARCTAAPQAKLFVDCDSTEMVRAVPELAGLQFDSNQDRLEALLKATGENLASMLGKLGDISAAEEIHEMRFESGMSALSRREAFRYRVRPLPNAALGQLEEFRIDPNTKSLYTVPQKSDFVVSGRFIDLLSYMLPANQAQSRFRYVGRLSVGGENAFVVAFVRMGALQGLVWIDAAANRILRVRIDLLGPEEGIQFKSFTTEIALVPVNFESIGGALWVPSTVTVHARYADGDLHTVHRFSDYRINGAGEPGHNTPGASGEDAWELLDDGIALTRQNKFNEAIPVLRQALHLNSEMPVAHFQLANAMRGTGDLAGAEAELREAARGAPDSGPVHNFLGIVLFKRGELAGALAEFRASAALEPKDPIVHFNLAEALQKQGDAKSALDEYRTASVLAPGNDKFKARLEQFERALNAPPGETTFKVDVRQVLVPVIVTDKDGHHVTGLTRAEFRVFEDGVEQKLSGFSVENAGVAAPPPVPTTIAGAGAESAAPAPAKPKRIPVRRTYLICIDSMHSAFSNLVGVRESLTKLFRSEQAGDAQYIVVALGTSMEIVQNTTSDPEAVLQALENKHFQKLYLSSSKASMQADMARFRQELNEIRAACDAGDASCMRKASLPSQAGSIAAEERQHHLVFLDQLRSLVQELSRGTDRRTFVLISDGFELVPGREAYELLVAFFPEFSSFGLRTVDRMPELEPVLRLAANHNIPIYTIDSRGLYTPEFFSASNPGVSAKLMPAVLSAMSSSALEQGQTLSEIAAATGGIAFHNSNDILGGLQRAFADGREYYMLAYVPSNSNSDGKFRAITVAVGNRKLVVNAKKGYWPGDTKK